MIPGGLLGLPWEPTGSPGRPKEAQENARRKQGRPKRAPRESRDSPQEVPGKPKRASEIPIDPQESRNHHQYGSTMVPTASPWVPQALPELTVIKNVRTSRNTIIRVRIACTTRPWRIPCLVILGQNLDYRSLQTGGRAPESSRRTQHPPRELQRAPSAPKRRPGHSPRGVVLPWRPLVS